MRMEDLDVWNEVMGEDIYRYIEIVKLVMALGLAM